MPPAGLRIKAVFAIIALLPPLFLVSRAAPAFIAGLGVESARGTVERMIAGQTQSRSAYRDAAAALWRAEDGESLAERAELLARASNDPRAVDRAYELVSEGVARAPADPRAWVLLCAIEASRDPGRGAFCLDRGFFVGRYDWYAMPWRMELAAREWPYLDQHVRDAAASFVLPMWNTEEWGDGNDLRAALFDLSETADGRQLLRAGFLADRNALRRFNHWVLRKRIDGS